MAEVRVDIRLDAQDEASRILKSIVNDIDKVAQEIEHLQKLGSDRTLAQEALLGLHEGLGTVGKDSEDTRKKLEKLQHQILQIKPGAGVKQVSQEIQTLGQTIKNIQTGFGSFTSSVATLTGGVISLGAFFHTAVAGAAELSKTIAEGSVASRDGAIGQQELKDAVLETANAYGESTQEIAGLYKEAVQQTNNMVEATNLVNTAVELGTATGQSFAASLSTITTVANATGQSLSEASKIADELFAIATRGRIPIARLGQAMGQLSIVGEQLGISTQELGAALIVLRDKGLAPQRAIRGLQTLMFKLQSTSKDMKIVLENNGFETFEEAVASKGLSGALRMLNDAAGGSTEILKKLVGTGPAFSAFAALTKDNANGINGALQEISASGGKVKDAAAIIEETFGEKMDGAIKGVRNAFVEVGAVMAPVFGKIFEFIEATSKRIQAFAKENPKLTGMITFSALAGALVLSLNGLVGVLGKLIPAFGSTGTAATGAAGGVDILGKALLGLPKILTLIAAHPIVAGLIALAAAVGFVIVKFQEAKKKSEDITKSWDKLVEAQKKLTELTGEFGAFEEKGMAELSGMTDVQIKAYKELLEAKIAAVEAEAAHEALIDKSSRASILLAADLLGLKRNLEEVNGQEKLRADLLESGTGATNLHAAAIKETTQEVKAYASALQAATSIGFDTQMQKLALLEEQTVQALSVSDKNKDRIRQTQEQFAQERIEIAEKRSAQVVQIAQVEADKLKTIAIDEAKTDLEKRKNLAKTITDIDVKRIGDQIKAEQGLTTAYQAERGKIVAAHKASIDKIKALEKELKDVQQSGRFEDIDLIKSGMTQAEKAQAAQTEFAQLNAEIQQAIREKDFTQARALADRQKAISKDVGGEIIENGEVLQTREQGIYNQLQLQQAARGNLLEVVKAEGVETKKNAATQEEQIAVLEQRITGLLDNIQKLSQAQVKLIDPENLAAVEETLKKTDAFKIVPVTLVPDTTQLDPVIKQLTSGVVNVPVQFFPAGSTPPPGAPAAPGYAAGGHVRGRGTGTSDSILARLSNGEFVMRADAVKGWGVGFMSWLNNYRPKFNMGGMVGRMGNSGQRTAFATGGLVHAGGGSTAAPVTLNLPFGSFDMSASTDVVSSLKRAVMRESLKRRGR